MKVKVIGSSMKKANDGSEYWTYYLQIPFPKSQYFDATEGEQVVECSSPKGRLDFMVVGEEFELGDTGFVVRRGSSPVTFTRTGKSGSSKWAMIAPSEY